MSLLHNASSLVQNSPQCTKTVAQSCYPLNQSKASCFGSSLSYDATSFDLVTDASNLKEAHDKLLLWSGLRAVPRCWDVIQPLLCSVYYPRCENNQIVLPDKTLCTATRSPCKIVETEYGWPGFLECHNTSVFREGCKAQTSFTFNKSDCEAPLIATNNSASFYDEVEGCGLQCMNPLFNQSEHDEIHDFIAGWATTACLCTLFAMLSFFIDWKNSSKYPARIIFYINLCFFVGGFGWLAQFIPGAREEIVCRRDGTMRLGEPVGGGESPSCVIIFVLVYYFLMAGITWFDILSYSWYLMFKALGTSQDPLIGKYKAFHAVAWSVPCVLLLICLGVSQIDGDSMSGICFVGYKNHMYRLGLLLIPVGIVLLVGGFFLFRGLVALCSIRTGHPGLLSDSAISKINYTMMRIGLFAILAFVFVFVTFAAHVYEFTHQALWEKSFRDYIKCEANVTILEQLSGNPPEQCVLKNHPNLSVIKLNLIALFGTGIVMSTWVWTKSSFDNWRRTYFKMICRSDNETKRIRRRSRIIAKAFAMRNILRRKENNHEDSDDDDDVGELEFSEHTMTHQDPVGMDFYLHSVSQEMSSTWIRNVPKMVERRGGLLPEGKLSAITAKEPLSKHKYIRERSAAVEPGLWAVSQYIDGSNMKTKTYKPCKKTAPVNHMNDMFIGTSPYNYPLNPMPVSITGDRQLHRLNCEEIHKHGEEYISPRMLPCTLPHEGQPIEWICPPPGYVNTEGDPCDVTSSPGYERTDPLTNQHAYTTQNCAMRNSNSNGNRVHYYIPPTNLPLSKRNSNSK